MHTLLIHDLPNSASKNELEQVFSSIGPIKTCSIVKKEMDRVGLVTFALEEDMQLALSTPMKMGKTRLRVSLPDGEKLPKKKIFKINKDKEYRQRKKSKKGKIIIKNLDFKVTPEQLEKTFKEFGKIVEVKIPLKEDGKSRGFGFVHFENTFDAYMAIKKLNKTILFDRPVAIDFAMSKNKYLSLKNGTDKKETKTEETVSQEEKCDEEPYSNDEEDESKNENDNSINEESTTDEENENELQADGDDGEVKSNEDDDEAEVKRNDDRDSDDKSEADDSPHKTSTKKKRAKHSDVDEGKTLFIRNISFDVDETTLHDTFSKFGPLKYSLLCVDKVTKFPKGTGFVQFLHKADAESCLMQVKKNPIFLDNRQIEVLLARPKNELAAEKAKKAKTGKDNRNLALLKEGYLAMGEASKMGISNNDLMLRQKLEKSRKIALQNLLKFVSKTRLVVYNIPPTVDDVKLRSIFASAAGKGAKITECRVMKDLKSLGPDGKPISKGFGFVNFATHEQAITALRNVNNKEKIFKPHRRPIVYFSIEDLCALRCKEMRTKRSQQKSKSGMLEDEFNNGDQEKVEVATAKFQNNFQKFHIKKKAFHKRKISFNGKNNEEQPHKKIKFAGTSKPIQHLKKQKKFKKEKGRTKHGKKH